MRVCDDCGEYVTVLFGSEVKHTCPERWLCWAVGSGFDDEDDAYLCRAMTAQDAAEDFAAKYDEDDNEIVNGGTLTVRVRKSEIYGGGPDRVFEVTGEVRCEYDAAEIDPPPQWTPGSCDMFDKTEEDDDA